MTLDRYNLRHMCALQEASKIAKEVLGKKFEDAKIRKAFVEKTAKEILNNTAH